MLHVKIPKKLKIGGFDYKIEVNARQDRELRSDSDWGQCAYRLKRITIDSDSSEQQMSETFLHEIIHAIDGIYGHYALTEDETQHLGNGLLQVFEQLGIRFSK